MTGSNSPEVWRADLEQAYALFVSAHEAKLTSKTLLEAALAAIRRRTAATMQQPEFTDRSVNVPEDLARFLETATQAARSNPHVTPEDLRDAAIDAMVELKPDGHTGYWRRVEDVPFGSLLAGHAELSSALVANEIGLARWSGWLKTPEHSTSEDVRGRLDVLLVDGARAWIFDVRGNMGGAGAEAVRLASMFLQGEELFVRRLREGTASVAADATERLPDAYQLPIAVIIDKNTWSASEIFAFSLQEHGRAVVIGERSAGRVGRSQSARLPGGGFLNVTIGEVSGPHGERYNGVGVTPDVASSSDQALEVAIQHVSSRLRSQGTVR